MKIFSLSPLIEAQSSSDRIMPFRIMEYMIQIMRHHLEGQKARREKQSLPFVYPIIYYTGKSKYRDSTDLFDLFTEPALARKHFLKPFQLIDLSQLSDQELRQHRDISVLELIQKHVHDKNIKPFLKVCLKEGFFRDLADKYGIDTLNFMLKYLVKVADSVRPKMFLKQVVEQLPEMEKKIMTMADRLKKVGKQLYYLLIAYFLVIVFSAF